MIIVTSISANHSNGDNQHNAIESWQPYGECYSLNNAGEITELSQRYKNINFIETNKTIEQIVSKPLVTINAMIDFAISKGDDLLLLNSDIIIRGLPEFKPNGISALSRYDYIDNFDDCKMFQAGFDVFYIPKEILKIFHPSIYAMGMSWWDYWIPYIAMSKNIPLYYPKGKYAFHKIHNTQYSTDEWVHIGEHFAWEFKMKGYTGIQQVGQLATKALLRIKNHLR